MVKNGVQEVEDDAMNDTATNDTAQDRSAVTACAVCETAAPSEPPPFIWSSAVERGRRLWTCERCARENIRSIEGKLDSAWW